MGMEHKDHQLEMDIPSMDKILMFLMIIPELFKVIAKDLVEIV